MTDITKYRNVSLSKDTYAILIKLSRSLLGNGTKLSISNTIESLANQKIKIYPRENSKDRRPTKIKNAFSMVHIYQTLIKKLIKRGHKISVS